MSGLEDTNITEEYDGTNWTAGGDTNEDRRTEAGMGTLTAGLVVYPDPVSTTTTFET